MFSILIAEDEAASMKCLKSIIEKECIDFSVISEAEDGAEALEKLHRTCPDVLITDIKMPVMDGIELVTKVNKIFPDMFLIIISGFSDFQYAQKAIKAGVCEYLLKPIEVDDVVKTLDSVKVKLEDLYFDKQIKILYDLLHNKEVSDFNISHYFPNEFYNIAVLRKGGLIKRFGLKPFNQDIMQGANIINDDNGLLQSKKIWFLNGRDENEAIIVSSHVHKNDIEFKNILDMIIEDTDDTYWTASYNTGHIKLKDLFKYLPELFDTIDNSLIIGKTQIIPYKEENQDKRIHPDSLSFLSNIEYYLSKMDFVGLKNDLTKSFNQWETEQKTAIWLEPILAQCLICVVKANLQNKKDIGVDHNKLLNQALLSSNSFSDLMNKFWDIIEMLNDGKNSCTVYHDSKNLFANIIKYIDIHYKEPLAVNDICKTFGISQTYFSRLFRKYKQITFNDYLNRIRIKKAKEIISNNSGIKLKDISQMVGYTDPSYFAKVFRSHTGSLPSEFSK